MSWQNEVKTALENNQYDIVSQFYEELIERETTEISYLDLSGRYADELPSLIANFLA